MSLKILTAALSRDLQEISKKRPLKGREKVIKKVLGARDNLGPRVILQDYGQRQFLRFNSNSYLGLNLHPEVIAAAERAAESYGAGPGAVRFIGGTYQAHVDLEAELAAFHQREAAILFSSAYGAVVGVLNSLITPTTLVISDAINHNSIINGIRLGRPQQKEIYDHLNYSDLERELRENRGKAARALVITDGVFSMRGELADLSKIKAVCRAYEDGFPEGLILLVDDSHGVGACGAQGRGTEEVCHTKTDILIGTLGKAIGVNGGYAVGPKEVIAYLRETSPLYVYTNPITPGEAAAARQSLKIMQSPEGGELLKRVRARTKMLEEALEAEGFEIIPGPHPIVPLLLRDSRKTKEMVARLFAADILVTGLDFPVVPQGDQEIRLQVNATHTTYDIELLVSAIKKCQARS